ncbi:MAG: hypothetical protein ACI8W3_003371 [Myxococcota bacterium]|jgi:hypothetical protein
MPEFQTEPKIEETNMTLRAVTLLTVFALLASAPGCASVSADFTNWFGRTQTREPLPAIVEPRVFLGGEALAQKKARMRRAHADLVHLYRGYELISRQQKDADREQLEGFIRPFVASQVDPLFSAVGEAWNPDLRLLEANLLFAEGALFVAIGEEARLEIVIDTIASRFSSHESLLIEYPIGQTQTLSHGIRDLRSAQASL